MKSQIPQIIRHNLLFLIAEVSSQIICLQAHINEPSITMASVITERIGYILTLMLRIHDESHNQITEHKENKLDSLVFRVINAIASSLGQIAQLCCDCTRYIATISNQNWLQADEYQILLDKVVWAIGLIDRAIVANNTQLALKIASVEQQLKNACNQLIERYIIALKNKDSIEDLIAAIFVARCIEHIGDALLNISEALISGNLGQAVNIDRYHSLSGFVEQLNDSKKNQQWVMKTIAETRSGSTISAISKTKNYKDNIVAIFKDGKKRKLQEEHESIAKWHQIYPGIAPKVLSYNVQGESAALLIEHLDGMTIESLLLKSSRKRQNAALKQLCATLASIWKTTRRKKIVSAHYMMQLKQRLSEVYRIHPDFKQTTLQVGDLTVLAFEELMKQAQDCEERLKPTFSVYIHGDFNSDNVIYDPLSDRVNFIDLHRSRYMDYVQDVSVFMVSNYRLQVLDSALRQRVLELTLSFYQFVADFAKINDDHNFELRLALGLARSFASSTRFILDKTLADAMFLRSRYLIEQVLSIMDTEQMCAYRVPIREIFVG